MDETVTCKYYSKDFPVELWEEVRPYIASAAEYAQYEFLPEDILEGLHSGSYHIWLVYKDKELKFVWTTEVLQQSARKVVVVLSAGGQIDYGWHFWPWMSQWMIGNKIDEAEVYCRPSMSRLLQKFGLKVRYEVLTIKPMKVLS